MKNIKEQELSHQEGDEQEIISVLQSDWYDKIQWKRVLQSIGFNWITTVPYVFLLQTHHMIPISQRLKEISDTSASYPTIFPATVAITGMLEEIIFRIAPFYTAKLFLNLIEKYLPLPDSPKINRILTALPEATLIFATYIWANAHNPSNFPYLLAFMLPGLVYSKLTKDNLPIEAMLSHTMHNILTLGIGYIFR